MDIKRLERHADDRWVLPCRGAMQVAVWLYGDEALIRAMDDKVLEQAANVAALPGVVKAVCVMPDAHWGYGFPIGGVAAFDADEGGVVSAGGVGFDISCGVRTLHTRLDRDQVMQRRDALADVLYCTIPAGVGSTGHIHLDDEAMLAMLRGGARWAVAAGYGRPGDLELIEEQGCAPDADPGRVSARARKRQQDEMGTLGSGNHYLEVQSVADVLDSGLAAAYGIAHGDVLISLHCGSRGLGHQIGTEYLRDMVIAAPGFGIRLPDRELACAPIHSELGAAYLGAMRAGINCALANRQILTHLTREAVARVFPDVALDLLYDVSHNTCKVEDHVIGGRQRRLYVHRKGATRAWGPGHPGLPGSLREAGQPVLIGGSMGTASYILAGASGSEERSFSSACHGAGRAMSRHEASRRWKGRALIDELARRGILIRSPSQRGVAEEAPGAYKDVTQVIEATANAGLARPVARLEPMICIKG